MAWYDTKSAAVDPDNPTADEQVTAAEWNAMRLELRNRLIGRDVDDSNLGDNRILVYDLASNTFVFEDPSAVASLNAIPDVTISGVPADNEGLAYDTATSKWINQTAAEAGLATAAQLTTLETAAVLNADFDATTFLYATADNTPQPKTRAEVMAILSGTATAEFLFNTQQIGGIVDPTTAQQAATKNYADVYLFTKEIVTDFTNGYVPVYRTASGKFEMEAAGAAGAVLKADFDATTFMYATADNTPLPKTPAEVMAILSGAAGAEFLFNTQNIGGVVDPTTAQQASTKNYADTRVATKELVTSFTDNYIFVYKTASGKFEMEEQSATAGLPVSDSTTIVKGSADSTKRMRFEVDGLTAGVTRIMTVPDKDMTICGLDDPLLLSGGIMGGDIDMSGENLNNLSKVTADDGLGAYFYNDQDIARIKIGERNYAFRAQTKASMDGNDLMYVGALCMNNATELTIASGVVVATQSYHTIDTEGDIASDNLDTISGGTEGMQLTIRAIDSTHTVVVKDSTVGDANLAIEGDMSLDNAEDTLSLIFNGTNWLETSRSNNGA